MSASRRTSVALVGLMGSGKTSVGRALAATLALPFVDLDDEIVRQQNATIPDLFNAHGESGFRHIEADVLRSLADRGPMVLACGGGTPLRPDNLAFLRNIATVVWLDVTPEIAVARAAGGGRPLLTGVDPGEKMRQLHAVRAPVYALADIRVDATGRPEAVVAEVCRALNEHGV